MGQSKLKIPAAKAGTARNLNTVARLSEMASLRLAARKIAEQDATQITVAAQAEREAAENRASAITTLAQADADAGHALG